jgi:hypothetical protein
LARGIIGKASVRHRRQERHIDRYDSLVPGERRTPDDPAERFDHAETVDAIPRLSDADLDRIDAQRRQRRTRRTLRTIASAVGGLVLLAAVGVMGWRVTNYDAHQAPAAAPPRHHAAVPAVHHHPAGAPASSTLPPSAAAPTAGPSCMDSCGEVEPVIFTAGDYSGTDPTSIAFSADGGNIAYDLSWGPWPTGVDGNVSASATVTGSGTVNIQGCVPACYDGSETPEPVTIVLSDPIIGDPTVWGQMTETIAGQNMNTMGGEGSNGVYTYPNSWALGAS